LKISNISRRGVFVLIAALAAQPLFAFSSNQAENLVDGLATDFNQIINAGKEGEPLYRDFEKLFKRYADLPIVARSALGVSYRSATNAQRRKFEKAFTSYVARKYGKQFKEFVGGDVSVTGSSKTKRGYAVNSQVMLQNSSPFEIVWQVVSKKAQSNVEKSSGGYILFS